MNGVPHGGAWLWLRPGWTILLFPEKVHHETQKSVPACLGVVPSCTKLAPENEGLGTARFVSCWDEGDGFFNAELGMC